jgi:seryl-tRNA synthetase
MWKIKDLEKNLPALTMAVKKRGVKLDAELDSLVGLVARRKDLIKKTDEINRKRNELSAHPAALDDGAAEQAKSLRAEVACHKEQIREVEASVQELVSALPNPPHSSVPEGAGEADNLTVHAWGEPRKFNFPVLDHVDLGNRLGMLDLVRGARVAASGFPSLRGDGAFLSRQLINFMLDQHRARGYFEIEPPFVCNRAAFYGTGQLPKFEQELYWTENNTLALVPTAEVPLTNLHAGEILAEHNLPLRYTAYTPCFRREAGAYGRDTRGIIRVHQFAKVELVRLARPEDSYDELERMVEDAENILQLLEIPYRRVLLCGGDLGFSAAKTYDIEAWFPGQGRYREISSVSNCEDFQAFRARIRLRRKDGSTTYIHTLNGSGLAVGRTWAAILENYQRADGSVQLPEVLTSYMRGIRTIRPV